MNHKTIFAIDPGTEESGFVFYNHPFIPRKGKIKNKLILDIISESAFDILVCEMIASYGMPVGQTTFETCVWIGRFLQLAELKGKHTALVFKKKYNPEIGAESVNQCICKNNKAKDKNIRQAIIDMYPATGGGKIPPVGIKSNPGPLFGISGDMWSALAVAITYKKSKDYQRRCEE